MADDIPDGAACRVKAWRPPGISEISEVFHARIVDYGYPLHCHDTWTVLIVDTGAISYDLDRKQCGALRETVAILPPGVTHNGKPAPGAKGFAKRVLYLDESVLPVDLIGAAVDRTNIKDARLRRSLAALHDDLVVGADPFAASSALAMIAERITLRLQTRPDPVAGVEQGVAEMLRRMLDEPTAGVDLANQPVGQARRLGRRHGQAAIETGIIARHHRDAGHVNRSLGEAARRAGVLKRVTSHILRHSSATHMHQAGVPMRDLQQILGHSSISTTETYVHSDTSVTKRVKSPIDSLPKAG